MPIEEPECYRSVLAAGLNDLGIEAGNQQLSALLEYLKLLAKWNKSYNLSGIREMSEMVTLHLLDSLAIAPYIDGDVVLDVGSGAGLPGIPLAIIYPQKKFILVDSNGKKYRFLFAVKTALDLENVSLINSRIQDYQCDEQIDIVVSRAFSSLSEIAALGNSVFGPTTRIFAMKGNYPGPEIEHLPATSEVIRETKLMVPGLAANRYLLELKSK